MQAGEGSRTLCLAVGGLGFVFHFFSSSVCFLAFLCHSKDMATPADGGAGTCAPHGAMEVFPVIPVQNGIATEEYTLRGADGGRLPGRQAGRSVCQMGTVHSNIHVVDGTE